MVIEWDEKKKTINYKKHGLAFEDAKHVFAGEIVTFIDDRKPYGEERLITLGALVGRVVVVVHTRRQNVLRIISMRKANEKERRLYKERLKSD